MRVVVAGASGLIGSAVAAHLAANGHEVVGLSRQPPAAGLSRVRHMALDLAADGASDELEPLLAGATAVVNCAGTLQDAPGESTQGVHHRGVVALIAACRKAGVRRLVHLSAVGVERQASPFSASKHAGEAALMASGLDWIILRPSVVIGRSAYGGSALMRGLAALPLQPVMPAARPLQLVWLDDLVDTVAFFLRPEAPAREILQLVGPRRWSFADAVGLLRCWMRWPRAKAFAVPAWLSGLLYKLGDAVSLLGWRPTVRSTARLEIQQGAEGDGQRWAELTGIVPTDIETALGREPASVQERWFARLYVLKPLVIGVLGLFWIATGLVSFGPGWSTGISLLREGGIAEAMAPLAAMSGASADILIGLAILYRPTSRYGLHAALLVSIAYVVIATILVPRLWSDPLGPLLKILPLMILNLVALAVREDR
jgi:uncharacterized protein YbjT (DUF2867 family)